MGRHLHGVTLHAARATHRALTEFARPQAGALGVAPDSGGGRVGLDVSITISGVREWDAGHRLSDSVAEWLGLYSRHQCFPDSATYREDLDALELRCITRFYGPGYERGPWPLIYAALRALLVIYPGATIRYGPDGDDPIRIVDAEFLEQMWEHYLGPDGDAYLRPFRVIGAPPSVE